MRKYSIKDKISAESGVLIYVLFKSFFFFLIKSFSQPSSFAKGTPKGEGEEG